jgi:ABC-type uncharacterized transport system permease subunit
MSLLLPLTLFTCALYGLMAWHNHRLPQARPVWMRVLLPIALAMHGALLFDSVLGQGDIRLGFGNSLSTIFWLTALIYWIASYGAPVAWVQSWVNGLAALSLLLMLFFSDTHLIPNSQTLTCAAIWWWRFWLTDCSRSRRFTQY